MTVGCMLYFFSKRYASIHGLIIHNLDWTLKTRHDSYYDHEISLYNWRYKPSQCEFMDGMSLARMLINKGENILDLCCGNGFNSYLFFSDIASSVDAIDYSSKAINYAISNYHSDSINFICGDILKYSFKQFHYDLVVWSSAIAYFSPENRRKVFSIIHYVLKKNSLLYVKTPLENFNCTAGSTQKESIYHIVDRYQFESEFVEYFNIEFCILSHYKTFDNLNYVLRAK